MHQTKQYTIRKITPKLDASLKQRAKETGQSLNTIILEFIKEGVGLSENEFIYNDLDDLIGSWVEDKEFDKALLAQDQIDNKLWY